MQSIEHIKIEFIGTHNLTLNNQYENDICILLEV